MILAIPMQIVCCTVKKKGCIIEKMEQTCESTHVGNKLRAAVLQKRCVMHYVKDVKDDEKRIIQNVYFF